MTSRHSFDWPSEAMIDGVKLEVVKATGCSKDDVLVVVSPFRVCPLGAHIDHQGGLVTAMALDKGILFGFISSGGNEVAIRSRQFGGAARFRLDGDLKNSADNAMGRAQNTGCVADGAWDNYAKGAVYALKKRGYIISKGVYGFIDGLNGLHGAGISSSAAVGISYLLALEHVNGLKLSPEENIHLDRSIENDFLGLKNGILDQSAILLSQKRCLTVIDCKWERYGMVLVGPLSSFHSNVRTGNKLACF